MQSRLQVTQPIPFTVYIVCRDNKYARRRFYTSLKWAQTRLKKEQKRYDDVHLIMYTRDVELK